MVKEVIIISKIIKCFEEKYPQKLLEIGEYPEKIYMLGNEKLLNSKKTVAIVGSRDCTEYGRKQARIFARELSEAGICVISGLAIGIDGAAHFGALGQAGGTIAVLGGGLNDIYPKENEWLYNLILQNKGAVITEYEDDIKALKSNFPKRNRLISGIADAVLVIEASYRSGSRITSDYARKQGKDVYCIPCNIDAPNSSGINELIREGAKIVTSSNELIREILKEDYNNMQITEKNKASSSKEKTKQNHLQSKEKSVNAKIDAEKKINETDENELYMKIYLSLQENELARDEISIKLNKKISEINTALTMMELEGYIEKIPGDRFRIPKQN